MPGQPFGPKILGGPLKHLEQPLTTNLIVTHQLVFAHPLRQTPSQPVFGKAIVDRVVPGCHGFRMQTLPCRQRRAIALDNVITIPATALGRTVGYLTSEQDALLARAIVLAYDLDIRLADK